MRRKPRGKGLYDWRWVVRDMEGRGRLLRTASTAGDVLRLRPPEGAGGGGGGS